MTNLFIDTSNQDVSIGIIKDNQILAQKQENIPNSHSIYTTSYIKQVLDSAKLNPEEIDKIIVTYGPGSFTGIRIGVTIAKVYAYLLKKQIIGVSSLKNLALSTDICGKCYLSLIDAKHDNYYIGLYDEKYCDLISEKFTNKKEVETIINTYNPIIISNSPLDTISSNVIKTLDLIKIVNYYSNKKTENPHFIKPNYLKLPGALEQHD